MGASGKLWLLFTAFVLYGCTIPFHFTGAQDAAEKLGRLPVSVWTDPETGRRPSIPDTVQNILLFIPFGVLGVLAGRRRTISRVVIVTGLGTCLSVVVETLQLFTTNRVTSLADVATNTAGALAGATAVVLFYRGAAKPIAWLRASGSLDVAEFKTLTVFTLLTLIAFLHPFDVTLELGTVASKVKAFMADPWQRTVLRDEGLLVMISCLFTMALASYVAALPQRNALARATAVALASVAALECSQFLVGSRMPGLWDAAVASSGVGLGIALRALSKPPRSRALTRSALIAMTTVAAALLMLSPFEISAEYRHFSWFPFRSYYERTTFQGLSHVVELGLTYFPLGYAFASTNGRYAPRAVTAVGFALLIAGTIEYLQGWIVGRFPDVSDIGLSLAGTAIGLMAGRPRTY